MKTKRIFPPAWTGMAEKPLMYIILFLSPLLFLCLSPGSFDSTGLFADETEVADAVPETESLSSKPRAGEFSMIREWAEFLRQGGAANGRWAGEVPFSFKCGGRSSREWIAPGKAEVQPGRETDAFRECTLSWKDEESGILCEATLVQYKDFPALEWVVYLENQGNGESEKIHDFLAADLDWKNNGSTTPWLRYAPGSDNRPDDFKLTRKEMRSCFEETLDMKFESDGKGWTSSRWLPFFNYETGGDGLVIGLGWNGDWTGKFLHNGESTRIEAGQTRLNAKLHPGERIRSMRVAMLYYTGEFLHGQNMFRQFMVRHHLPCRDGQPVLAPVTLSGWAGPEEEHMRQIKTVKEWQIPSDAYWIDAAWYGRDRDQWWAELGDWEVAPHFFPSGSLRPVSDAAADAGMKFMLWVEPLRAMGCTKAAKEHADCFLRRAKGPVGDNEQLLLNLATKKGLDYGVALTSKIIEDYNVQWYREDLNTDPSANWVFNDEPDREGLMENHFADGFYAFWDALLEKYPFLAIDQCCGGGRRIELEALTRSMPLWRNDFNCTEYRKPEDSQNQSYNLSYWIPSHGTGAGELDKYYVRNVFCPGISFPFAWADHPKLLKERVSEMQRAKEYFYGDYYPLLDGGQNLASWSAYYYYVPEKKAGMLMAIRRPESEIASMSFNLVPLDSDGDWEFEDADTGEVQVFTGSELKDNGFWVAIPEKRRARLFFYRQK